MEPEKLQKIGLNRNEAIIYLALLDLGEAQAGKISKETQINRTTVYDSIERLMEKGLITFIMQANKKTFRPVSPEKFLEKIREQEETAKEILPELQLKFKSSKEKQESNIYKGRKGINSILNDILKHREYVAFGSSGNFLQIMKHDFIAFQRRKREQRINSRVILPDSSRKSEQVRVAYTKFRFIPDEFSSPTTTFIYGNYTAIIVWSDIPIATVIKNKDASKSFRNYFELLWKIAKK